jgi:hypothetical protein
LKKAAIRTTLIKCPNLPRCPFLSASSLIPDLENNISQNNDNHDVNHVRGISATAVYEEVHSFYSCYNRAKLAEIDEILERYEGREE